MKVPLLRILTGMALLAFASMFAMPVQAADMPQSYDFCSTFQPKSAADKQVWAQNCGGTATPVGDYCATHKFPGLFGSKEAWKLWKENGCKYNPPTTPPDHPSTNNPPPDDEYTPPDEEEEPCPPEDDEGGWEDDEGGHQSDWGDDGEDDSDWGDDSDDGGEESDWGDD